MSAAHRPGHQLPEDVVPVPGEPLPQLSPPAAHQRAAVQLQGTESGGAAQVSGAARGRREVTGGEAFGVAGGSVIVGTAHCVGQMMDKPSMESFTGRPCELAKLVLSVRIRRRCKHVKNSDRFIYNSALVPHIHLTPLTETDSGVHSTG